MPRRTPKRIVDFFKNSNDSEEPDMGNTNNSQQKDEAVLSLLRKISDQLDSMGGTSADSPASQSAQPDNPNPTQQQSNSPEGSAGSGIQVLYNLLQQSLNQQNAQTSNQAESTAGSGGQESYNSVQQNVKNQNSASQGKKDTTMTKDAAQQILEQAQYELANELEASLKKLKEVISESENLATKISALIGQDSNQKKS